MKKQEINSIFFYSIMENYFLIQNYQYNLLILNDKIKVLYKT